MTNSFTSNTSCFIGARLHVSVFSDHHQAFLRINSKNAGLHIGIPSMFTVLLCVVDVLDVKLFVILILNFNTSGCLQSDFNTFTAIVDLSRFNNSCLKSPASTLVDLTFQSRALRSFSLNHLRNLSL